MVILLGRSSEGLLETQGTPITRLAEEAALNSMVDADEIGVLVKKKDVSPLFSFSGVVKLNRGRSTRGCSSDF